jgi:hypothetical protein
MSNVFGNPGTVGQGFLNGAEDAAGPLDYVFAPEGVANVNSDGIIVCLP